MKSFKLIAITLVFMLTGCAADLLVTQGASSANRKEEIDNQVKEREKQIQERLDKVQEDLGNRKKEAEQ